MPDSGHLVTAELMHSCMQVSASAFCSLADKGGDVLLFCPKSELDKSRCVC